MKTKSSEDVFGGPYLYSAIQHLLGKTSVDWVEIVTEFLDKTAYENLRRPGFILFPCCEGILWVSLQDSA